MKHGLSWISCTRKSAFHSTRSNLQWSTKLPITKCHNFWMPLPHISWWTSPNQVVSVTSLSKVPCCWHLTLSRKRGWDEASAPDFSQGEAAQVSSYNHIKPRLVRLLHICKNQCFLLFRAWGILEVSTPMAVDMYRWASQKECCAFC